MFNIKDYLENEQWEEKSEGFFSKGFKKIKMVGKNKLMIALNFDKKVKHKHIVTCKVPQNEAEANVLFDLTMLNQKN